MTTQAELKRRILKNRGVEFAKHTRKPRTPDDIPAPFHKTRLMKYIELKHKAKLQDLLSNGTIYQLEKKLGIDATTISKWRKLIRKAEEDAFWQQFPNTNKGEIK